MSKKKVAKLVLWSPMTRVVVDEDATYDEIVEAARDKFKGKLDWEYEANIEEVLDDEECPYDPEEEGVDRVFITAQVPTTYQLNSIASFGLPISKHLNGTISVEQEFDSVDKAECYLIERAGMYTDDENEFEVLRDQVLLTQSLTLDAATAHIEIIKC